jgi:hypothetical protein
VDRSTEHRSSFGGLWTDRLDADDELERRVSSGSVPAHHAARVRSWITDGYTVFPRAVPGDLIDRFRDDIVRAFDEGDDRLLVNSPGTDGYVPLQPRTSTVRARVVDAYAHYPSARALLFAPPIVEWLRLLFDEPPMLFQSLSFDRGSQQGMHQDTAYVVVHPPLHMAAAWIALEDVIEGSGELVYLHGSHRLPEYRFSGEHKHWSPDRDGLEQHDEWSRLILENGQALGMERRAFLARKGDVFIWSADLAHGGAPARDDTLTRRSLVGHYCPRSARPNFFVHRSDRSTAVQHDGSWYASGHYDLAAAVPDDAATPAPGLLTRLAQALRR